MTLNELFRYRDNLRMLLTSEVCPVIYKKKVEEELEYIESLIKVVTEERLVSR